VVLCRAGLETHHGDKAFLKTASTWRLVMGIVSDRERNFPHYLLARLLFVGVILGLALAFLVESPQERWLVFALFLGNLFLLGLAWVWFTETIH
jgi:hypothetical protein